MCQLSVSINPDKILKASISNLESVSSKIESVELRRSFVKSRFVFFHRKNPY